MKQYSVQLAVLVITSWLYFCSATPSCQCPPAGVQYKTLVQNYDNMPENWKLASCGGGPQFCAATSCWDCTYAKIKKGFAYQASFYNDSSSKVLATTGYLYPKEPGVFEMTSQVKGLYGIFNLLLSEENLYIFTGCMQNTDFYVWVNTRTGKLEKCQEAVVEDVLKKNGVNVTLRSVCNQDCERKKYNTLI